MSANGKAAPNVPPLRSSLNPNAPAQPESEIIYMPNYDSHGYHNHPPYADVSSTPLFDRAELRDRDAASALPAKRNAGFPSGLADALPVVPRHIGNDEILTIDARPLHAYLGVRWDFSDWMKDLIKRFNLVANRDFKTFPGKTGKGRPSLEYALPLDIATHICIVCNTEKSWEARVYFINAAKELRALKSRPKNVVDELDVLIEAKRAILASRQESESLRHQLEEVQPAVAFAETVIAADMDVNLSDVGRLYGISSKEGIDRMLREGILYRERDRKRTLKAFQPYRNRDFFRWVEDTYTHPHTGESTSSFRTVITPEGRIWLFARWKKADEEAAARGTAA